MTNETTTGPTLETLAEILGGTVQGDRVVLSFGRLGYLTVRPSTVWGPDHRDIPAAEITGRLSAGNGAHHARLRAKLEAAGIRPR